jgi:putative membrane protein
MTSPMTLAAAAGLLLAVVLIAWQGPGAVVDALAGVGLGALWIVLIRALQIAGAGLAWWMLIPAGSGALLRGCLLLRWVRDAINTLLPVAQIGGEIVGARLLVVWHIGGGLAGASVLVDLLVQTATQLAFSFLGVSLLARLGGEEQLIRWLLVGLAVMTVAVAGFFASQRMGGVRLLERLLLNIASSPRWHALISVGNVHQALQVIYARHAPLAAAAGVHLIVWFIGALEIWIALAYMGYPVGYVKALAIESLGHAVRAAGFLIPAGLGVQEGGFAAICAVLGIPAPAAIALSLVKRVPEIALGIPGLVAWRILEGREQKSAAWDAVGVGPEAPQAASMGTDAAGGRAAE